MKFTRSTLNENYVVKAYTPGSLTVQYLALNPEAGEHDPQRWKIRELTLSASVILAPGKLIENWPPRSFAELQQQHLRELAQLQPELVLLGTGSRIQFPHSEWMGDFLRAGIGFEVMDTAAACRTYNILTGEGRQPVAALLLN